MPPTDERVQAYLEWVLTLPADVAEPYLARLRELQAIGVEWNEANADIIIDVIDTTAEAQVDILEAAVDPLVELADAANAAAVGASAVSIAAIVALLVGAAVWFV